MEIKIRKKDFLIEKKFTEMGENLDGDFITATIAVTAENPCAGKYQENLSVLSDWAGSQAKGFLKELLEMSGLTADDVVSFGKSAIIGINGELEHGAALLHPSLGNPVREVLKGSTVLPSTIKVGLPGESIDAPYDNKSDANTLDYVNNITLSVPGAPLPDEFVLLITIATNMRPLVREYEGAVDLSQL